MTYEISYYLEGQVSNLEGAVRKLERQQHRFDDLDNSLDDLRGELESLQRTVDDNERTSHGQTDEFKEKLGPRSPRPTATGLSARSDKSRA